MGLAFGELADSKTSGFRTTTMRRQARARSFGHWSCPDFAAGRYTRSSALEALRGTANRRGCRLSLSAVGSTHASAVVVEGFWGFRGFCGFRGEGGSGEVWEGGERRSRGGSTGGFQRGRSRVKDVVHQAQAHFYENPKILFQYIQ